MNWTTASGAFVMGFVLAGCGGSLDAQGHRGARGLFPENTLAGFAAAQEMGVCTLEMDVVMTADDILVAHHDTKLNSETTRASGKWLVGSTRTVFELPYEQLEAFDVGRLDPSSAYASRFPKQTAVDGALIPKLRDVIRRAEAKSKTIRYNIETKLDPEFPYDTAEPEILARSLLEVVRTEGIASRTTIQSFDWRTLLAVQRRSDVATSCLTSQAKDFDTVQRGKPGPSTWTANLDIDDHDTVPHLVQAAGCDVWSPNFEDVTRELVQIAHGLGLRVAVWTVNEDSDIETMIDHGVDAIISDYPDRVLRIMDSRGITSRCESP